MGAVWAVVVAAGSGSRFGRRKQYELIGDRTVLERAVDAAADACDGVVVVLPPGTDLPPGAVGGGATRSASVRHGLAAVPPEAEIVVVHDAARPLAAAALFFAAIDAVRAGADAAICAVPVTDTIKRVSGASVIDTLDRSELVAVQTPQAFKASALRAAHAGEADATDDAGLIEAAGGSVVVVPGSPTNIKITHPSDLAIARALA